MNGDTATAKFIWTGIINEQIKAPPRFVEQGREYDRLVKRNGQWRITKRGGDRGLRASRFLRREPHAAQGL